MCEYSFYKNLYEIDGYNIIESGKLEIYKDIAYTAYDIELDDFEDFGIVAGIYEYRLYKHISGYTLYQIVIDNIEIDIPDGYYIIYNSDTGNKALSTSICRIEL